MSRSTAEKTNVAERPKSLDLVPAYQSLLSNGFQRIHIHLKGIRSSKDDGGIIAKRKNRFFGFNKLLDAVADPYCTVECVSERLTPPDYFAVHKHTFPVLQDSSRPFWDAKGTVLALNPTALKFKVLDKNRNKDDEVLMEVTVTDLPAPITESIQEPGPWTELAVKPDDKNKDEDLELVLALKITEHWVVSPEEIHALTQSTDEVQYSEKAISNLKSTAPEDNALLQCWTKKKGGSNNNKAVLWILGRNDCFMHPHVTQGLFADYDVYVLNYSMNGACRKRGWVRDAHWNSHNKYGDFNIYCDQIAQAIAIMSGGNNKYETVLGYAHSTGGPVLLNYLMERGDDDFFDGFLFNSPFLDWGFVGGDLVEVMLENMGWMQKLGMLSLDQKLGAAVTPEDLKKTPIHYLGEEIVLCPWSAKIWSQYYFPWDCRPMYKVPMTGGFAKGVTAVHVKLEKWHKQKKPVTTKPFLCITSRGDDVLKSQETVSRADWIGPSRCEVELNDNAHDVFLSQDVGDTALALDMCKAWMKSKGF